MKSRDGENGWMETTATVTGSRVSWNLLNLLSLLISERYITERAYSSACSTYIIKFSYEVGGNTFNGKFSDSASYEKGDTFKISYDPLHPDKNTETYTPRKWLVHIIVIAIAILFAYWTLRR
jgi:hypothetical protein